MLLNGQLLIIHGSISVVGRSVRKLLPLPPPCSQVMWRRRKEWKGRAKNQGQVVEIWTISFCQELNRNVTLLPVKLLCFFVCFFPPTEKNHIVLEPFNAYSGEFIFLLQKPALWRYHCIKILEGAACVRRCCHGYQWWRKYSQGQLRKEIHEVTKTPNRG